MKEMIIRLVNENDRQNFNNFVSSSLYSSIYQSFEWGEIRKFDGWEVIRLVALNENKIVGALSCLHKKMPLSFRRIYYVPRGPILDYSDKSAISTFQGMFHKLIEMATTDHACFIRVSPDISDIDLFRPFIERFHLVKTSHPILHTSTYRIDLTKSEDELLKMMESRVRYDVRKANRASVEIVQDGDPDELLLSFYSLLTQVSERNKFPIYSYDMMKNIWETLALKGMCKIFLAVRNGKVISGAFILILGKKCVYQWGGSVRADVNPNQLLHWKIIYWAKSNGFLSYDLQGVPENVKEGDDLWGIYLFKRGFGGIPVHLIGEYDFVLYPWLYKIWQMIEPSYPTLKQTITKLIGEK